MRKGENKMRAKYSVTHYETYSKTVLEVLDEFLWKLAVTRSRLKIISRLQMLYLTKKTRNVCENISR